jgi:N-acetylglucosaminyldiphosphoundecaprenol N-acetyl-beta-D-mannosaminyltransferase
VSRSCSPRAWPCVSPGLLVAGTMSLPFRPLTPEEDAAVIERINAATPGLVWVGLSTPNQER